MGLVYYYHLLILLTPNRPRPLVPRNRERAREVLQAVGRSEEFTNSPAPFTCRGSPWTRMKSDHQHCLTELRVNSGETASSAADWHARPSQVGYCKLGPFLQPQTFFFYTLDPTLTIVLILIRRFG